MEGNLASGQFYEAVLPLPACASGSGCRSVVASKDPALDNQFTIHDMVHITGGGLVSFFF